MGRASGKTRMLRDDRRVFVFGGYGLCGWGDLSLDGPDLPVKPRDLVEGTLGPLAEVADEAQLRLGVLDDQPHLVLVRVATHLHGHTGHMCMCVCVCVYARARVRIIL